MASSTPKTKETTASVDAFIHKQPEGVAADCRAIIALMKKATGEAPRMWGSSIVGFGRYVYTGSNGKPVEWMVIGFSPRKANLALYIHLGGMDKPAPLLEKLGKHSTGKGCLYIKKLSDVDTKVLAELIAKGVKTRAKDRLK